MVDNVQLLDYQESQDELQSPMSKCGMGLYGIGISINGDLHPCQEENGMNEVASIGNIYDGLNYEAHEKYCENIYDNWIEYLKNIDRLSENSLSFKLFLANNYCSTRLKDNFAFNNT